MSNRAPIGNPKNLISFAEGRIEHENRGHCPGPEEGFNSRDPNCAVCSAISAALMAKDAGAVPPTREDIDAPYFNRMREADQAAAAREAAARAQDAGDVVAEVYERFTTKRDSLGESYRESEGPALRFTGTPLPIGTKLYAHPSPAHAGAGDAEALKLASKIGVFYHNGKVNLGAPLYAFTRDEMIAFARRLAGGDHA